MPKIKVSSMKLLYVPIKKKVINIGFAREQL